MEYEEFFNTVSRRLPIGTILQNPGGGTSTIESYTDRKMAYRRGHSRIYVAMRTFYDAYKEFAGRSVSSTDLKEYLPQVFDSKQGGHSCNCTTFFMTLQVLGIVRTIEGAGIRGNPFWIAMPTGLP